MMKCNLCDRLGQDQVCVLCDSSKDSLNQMEIIELVEFGKSDDETDKFGITDTDVKKAIHHGNNGNRIKPIDIGTDYFSFACPKCSNEKEAELMFPFRLRQCKGGGDDGRLIINLACPTCGFKDARKLYGIDHFRKVRLEVCEHVQK